MASKKTRANTGSEILKYIVDQGLASNSTDAAKIYRALEQGDGSGQRNDLREGNNKTITKALINAGLTSDQASALTKYAWTTMKNNGVTNLMNYNRLYDNSDDDYKIDLDNYIAGTTAGNEAKNSLFNSYYNDVSNWQDSNTSAGQAYNALLTNEQNAALDSLAQTDLTAQQQSLQQAELVKNIADQVRSERMSQLRAGMSESQIAQADMQSMMTNLNAIRENNAALNTARSTAQSQYNNAQQTAYNAYLSSYLPSTSTLATGSAAADAGDADMLYQKIKQNNPNLSDSDAYTLATKGTTKSSTSTNS